MPTSFASSARRHRRDAVHLAGHARYQNAAHLAGLAAECMVKATLEQAGIDIDANKVFRTHFPDLGVRVRLLGHTRHMAPLLLILGREEFLAGWQIESRYDEDDDSESIVSLCDKHLTDIGRLFSATGFF